MGRALSGGRSGGIGNRSRTVSGSGAVFTLARSLGSASNIALRSGSNANLTLAGTGLIAASPLAKGETQVALIRESAGSGLTGRAVEYAVTLTGAEAGTMPEPYPGPSLSTAGLAGAYGLGKLVSAYAGPALRARRASDGAERDLGFAGELFDIAAAEAFGAPSRLTVAVMYDQTGNGQHLTQPNPATQPTLWLGEGGPTVTNYDTDSPMLIPPTLAIQRADCAVFMVARTPGQSATCGYWGFGTTATDFGLTSPRSAGNLALQPMVAGASIPAAMQNAQALAVNNLSVLGLVSSAGKQVVHRDGQTVDYPAAAQAVLDSGGEVGEAIEYGGRTDWRAFIVYSMAPSDGQVAAIKSALQSRFSTAEPATLSFLAGGDSIIFGTGGSNNRTITAALHHRSAPGVLFRNIGIAGHRLDLAQGGFDKPSAAYLSPGVPNIYFSDYGHNDIKTHVSDTASAISAVEAMKVQARHMTDRLRTYGFDMVIWQEAYADTSFTAAQETARNAWNAWLRSNPLADDGLPCFDAVDQVASDAAFLLSDAETGAGRGMASTANSSDGVHPNEAHAGIRADHFLATYAALPFGVRYLPVPGQQGMAYAGYRPRMIKGAAPFAFDLAPGSAPLPTGLSLDRGTGVVSGVPAGTGDTENIVLRVTDSAGAIVDTTFTISVAAATVIAVSGRTESWNASDATGLSVNMPTTVSAGDVLLAVMAVDAVPTITWDNVTVGDWSQVAHFVSNANAHSLAVFARTADGTEGGRVLTVTLSGAQQAVTQVMKITGATGKVEVSDYMRGAATAAGLPPIAPSWTGASLYIAALGMDGTATVSAGPSGYLDFHSRASSASGQATVATAWKISAGVEDADAFSLSASGQWVTALIALEAG